MKLSDLLISYKRVDAPRFTPSIPIIEQFPSYQTLTDREINTPSLPSQEEPIVSLPTQTKPTTSYSITTVQAPGFKAKWTSPYKDRNKWVSDLTQAYRRAGITNDNAIKMLIAQDALESAWGRSAQGKFNFGNLTTGSSWKGDYVMGNDKNAKGEAIKQKFRSYNSMDEYAADKLQFLKKLYDFDENDDIDKFVAKLIGSNRGKRKYAEAKNYATSLTNVFNSFRRGGIVKYQNPAGPLSYGNTFRFIKNLENPNNKGIRNGIAYKYDANTAGYGTDFVNGPHRNLKKKILSGKWTAKEARDQAVIDMRAHDNIIMNDMKKYTNRPDTISETPRLLMAQASYHYGNIKKVFPEWAKAVVSGNAKKQKEIALRLAKGYPDRYKRILGIQIYGGQK